MEFEKGKFYEVESQIANILQYVGLSPLSKDTFIYTYCSIDQLIGCDCGLSDSDKVINTFDNIHEVSKRIKQIEERKDWPVQVGQIWEVSWDGGQCHYILRVDNIRYYPEGTCPDYIVTIMEVIACKYSRQKGQTEEGIGIYPNDKNSTLLTQDQYEQRVKELEREEIKKKIKELGWVELINCDDAIRVKLVDNEFVWAVGNANYPLELVKPVTEQEAPKTLTGKDYVLLKEGQDVYDMKTVEEWRQLAEAYDSEHIKELQEENKQLRKALVYHGVWPSEDVTPVGQYKEAINRATKLQQEAIETLENQAGEATGNEMKGLLNIFNDEVKNNPCTRIFKAENQDRTFTINYRDGMILDIHNIVLQLKEKYLS